MIRKKLRYFKYSEFDQKGWAGSGEKFMDEDFLHYLDDLRHRCGFPLVIDSAYRSPEYNDRVSNSGLTGAHTTGKAVDIRIKGERAYIVLREAFKMGCFTGIGVNQKGDNRYIHLDSCDSTDNLPRPRTWSY